MTVSSIDRISWPEVIQRLERHYLHIEIGSEVEKSESWVCRLKNGIIRQPGHWEGVKLLAMDAELQGSLAATLAQIPTSIRADVPHETADPQVRIEE